MLKGDEVLCIKLYQQQYYKPKDQLPKLLADWQVGGKCLRALVEGSRQ